MLMSLSSLAPKFRQPQSTFFNDTLSYASTPITPHNTLNELFVSVITQLDLQYYATAMTYGYKRATPGIPTVPHPPP